jgi:hypothetical protein
MNIPGVGAIPDWGTHPDVDWTNHAEVVQYLQQFGGSLITPEWQRGMDAAATQAVELANEEAKTAAEEAGEVYVPPMARGDEANPDGNSRVYRPEGGTSKYKQEDWDKMLQWVSDVAPGKVPEAMAMARKDLKQNSAPGGYLRTEETVTPHTKQINNSDGSKSGFGGGVSLGTAMPEDPAEWIQARPDLQGGNAIKVPQLRLSKGAHDVAESAPAPQQGVSRAQSGALQNLVTVGNAGKRAEAAESEALANELRG